MELYFLQADVPLRKKYTLKGDDIEKQAYPQAKNFTSDSVHVETLGEFCDALKEYSNRGACLLKGKLAKTLQNESRAGQTEQRDLTEWVCFDFDGIPLGQDETIDDVLEDMGLGNISYILQYSASHKITKSFSAHVYMLLDTPTSPALLKTWFMHMNLEYKRFKDALSLTRTSYALRWPLDVTTAENSRLIYLAEPLCQNFPGPSIGERFRVVYKDQARIHSSQIPNVDIARVEHLKGNAVNRLRKDKGLPSKTTGTKFHQNVPVARNVDPAQITGMKTERGFVYLNLNGGDSWGYYHPENNIEFIYNFKGEPTYATRELLPSYYQEERDRQLKERRFELAEDNLIPFAFLDRRSDTYYRGVYNQEEDCMDVYSTNTVKKLSDFCQQNGISLGDYIEEWDYTFDFQSDVIFDPKNKRANRFQRSPYLRREIDPDLVPQKIPPIIHKVLDHVVKHDQDALRHLLNWMATIIQHRKKAETAWVLSGAQGTGKSLLCTHILAPIFGERYVAVKSLADLEETYNAYMEECILLVINESKTSQIKNVERVMARLKELITDDYISIRRMRTDAYMAENCVNVIVTSNKFDPVELEATDRRYNVCDYQHWKIQISPSEVDQIENELWDFAQILRTMHCDPDIARRPVENDAREKLKLVSQTASEAMLEAIREGNMMLLAENLPTDDFFAASPVDEVLKDNYKQVVRECYLAAINEEEMVLTRDQIRVILEFTVGRMPKTPNKFSAFLKHHNVFLGRFRKHGRLVPSIKVKWKKPDHDMEDMQIQQRIRAVE